MYLILVIVGALAVLIPLFMKYVHESPLHVMTTTAEQDWCKFILNSIAIINEEDIIKEKIFFQLDSASAKERRTVIGIVKRTFDSRRKLVSLGLMSWCWLAYYTGTIVHFVFLERL